MEKFTLDFNSDVSFEDQTKAGMKSLRKACLNSLEEAKIDRQARLERAKEAHLREQVQRIREREEYFARIDEETRLADEARVREEEQEVSCDCEFLIPSNAIYLLDPMLRSRRGGAKTKRSLQPNERIKSLSSAKIGMQEPKRMKLNAVARRKLLRDVIRKLLRW